MNLKNIFLIVVIFVVQLCVADIYWKDATYDHTWGNSSNWDDLVVPDASSGIVYVKAGSISSPKAYPVIYSPVPEIYRLTIGGSGNGVASVTVEDSGILDVQFVLRMGHYSSEESDVHGKLIVSGGVVNVAAGGYIDVGSLNTDGTLTINSGSVNTPRINIPASRNSNGIVQIKGGSLNVEFDGVVIANDTVFNKSGLIDISGGSLIVDGDASVILESYVAQGSIIGYSGNSTVSVDYDQTNPGKTTVKANSYDQFTARVPSPFSGKKEVPVSGSLNWVGGDWAIEHDVYIGTDLQAVMNATNMQPDINGNGWIDQADVVLLADNWLSTSPVSGDIDRSGEVDLNDFTLLAKDYGKQASDIYRGRVGEPSFDYDGLVNNKKYYWRVDEVNGDLVWGGDVWEFTSKIYVDDSKSGWELSFSDEFNGDDVDWEVWASEAGYPTHILSSRWPENAIVENGTLRLLTKKESRGGAEWTTGNLWTRIFKQKHGYWEASYRIGSAPALNNAFWMIKGGEFEIDIDEGHYPDTMNMNLHNWAGEHWATGATYETGLPLSQEFHKRAVEWTPTLLIYYFDDVEVRRVDYSKLDINVDAEVEVRLSTAVIPWTGEEITDALDGTSMDFDYVRIYEKDYDVDPARLIEPSTITATALNTSQYGTRYPLYAVNGAGLSGDNHATGADNVAWMADYRDNWFKVDLGQSFELDFIKIWNFNMTGYTSRGIKTADVYYSDSESDPGNPRDNPENWSLYKAGVEFTEASGRTDYGTNEDYNMPDILDISYVNARWIVFDIQSNHAGDPSYTGISELQFIKK
ncbi:MAG: family 16 glycosylhydrolase [Sedimentisphaeraceae bacterium JB056]